MLQDYPPNKLHVIFRRKDGWKDGWGDLAAEGIGPTCVVRREVISPFSENAVTDYKHTECSEELLPSLRIHSNAGGVRATANEKRYHESSSICVPNQTNPSNVDLRSVLLIEPRTKQNDSIGFPRGEALETPEAMCPTRHAARTFVGFISFVLIDVQTHGVNDGHTYLLRAKSSSPVETSPPTAKVQNRARTTKHTTKMPPVPVWSWYSTVTPFANYRVIEWVRLERTIGDQLGDAAPKTFFALKRT